MKRITHEEAKKFIPISEDYSNNPPTYFTVEKGQDEWDEITYYTGKKRGLYVGRDGDECHVQGIEQRRLLTGNDHVSDGAHHVQAQQDGEWPGHSIADLVEDQA